MTSARTALPIPPLLRSLVTPGKRRALRIVKTWTALKTTPGKPRRHRFYFRIRPTHLPYLLNSDEFIPQAIVNRPVHAFTHAPANVVSGADDFDEYTGLGFFAGNVPFAVMHYKGHPARTSTIYLPQSVRDVRKVSYLLRKIFAHFDLPSSSVIWQRRDSPDL
jgi:hypothetical protein